MHPSPEYWMALRALASLAITLGLMLTLAWAWRTYGNRFGLPINPTAKKPRLQVLESKRLNPHTTLYLVRADETEILLSATAAQTTVIHTQVRKKSAKVGA